MISNNASKDTKWIIPVLLQPFLIAVDIIVASGQVLTVAQSSFIFRVITCFPELYDDICAHVDLRRENISAIDLVQESILASIDSSQLPQFFDDLGLQDLLKLDPNNLMESVFKQQMDLDQDDIFDPSKGDTLFLSASAKALRDMMRSQRVTEGAVIQGYSIDLELMRPLRNLFRQGLVSAESSHFNPECHFRSVSDLIMTRFGFSDIRCLRSSYATFNYEKMIISGYNHQAGGFFLYGPYISLEKGNYMLTFKISSCEDMVIQLEIVQTSDGLPRVLSKHDLVSTSKSRIISIHFVWPINLSEGQFESRMLVVSQRDSKLDLSDYKIHKADALR